MTPDCCAATMIEWLPLLMEVVPAARRRRRLVERDWYVMGASSK
jgi:hypothetical protein